jgi:uncharacterized protein
MFTFDLSQIVLQPTTRCNMNCEECYLWDRNKNFRMKPQVPMNLVSEIGGGSIAEKLQLIWHSGEPLVTGLTHFNRLLDPFCDLVKNGSVTHYVQTNGTLINDEWCELFLEHQFNVGVSLNGPRWANAGRVNWAGKETFDRTMRGISFLNKHEIPFDALAVVTDRTVDFAEEIYNFFTTIGCKGVAFNIEETEGVHTSNLKGQGVRNFWNTLCDSWQKNPKIRVREFNNVFSWARYILEENPENLPSVIELLPSISWKGDVVFLSPEFLGYRNSKGINTFVVGNILKTRLSSLVKQHQEIDYVQEHLRGVEKCLRECSYFSYCGGGMASNKFFENGDIATTETDYCINGIQLPVDTVLSFVNDKPEH